MTLFLVWAVFPLAFTAVALGCGLLLDVASGRRLPGILLVPAGFALVIAVSTFTTMANATAPFTTPVVLALAAAGYGLAWPLRLRVDRWAVLAAVGVYAVYAAPIVLSGATTFAGYISLDDTATWLAIADNAVVHGRATGMLAPSTYSLVLRDYLGNGYPIGSMVPLGIAHQLTGQDAAWLFQPLLAYLASLLSLVLYALSGGLVRARTLRALVAFVGAQATLLFGYAFWNGIKELTAAMLLALIAALLLGAARDRVHPRAVIPLAVGAGALLSTQAVVGAIWFAAPVALAALLFIRRGLDGAGRSLAVLAGAVLVLAVPALATARAFFRFASSPVVGSVTNGTQIGNLHHALSGLQVFGIWPVGDFRDRPHQIVVTYLLIALVAVAATVAIAAAVRGDAWGLPVYTATAVGGCFLIVGLGAAGRGSPWLDAKALASASPALPALALGGLCWLYERHERRGLRALALAAGVAAVGGVLWSNALAYGSVWLAPHAQLAELETIGHRFAGDGPTLETDFVPYGARHFLRALDPEGASERRYRIVALRQGGSLDKGQSGNLDGFTLDAITLYRTLVVRTSPLESRPPSIYSLVWRGRWYEVWQRPQHSATIIDHLPLGTTTQPVSVPSCPDVRRLATEASAHSGHLVAARRARAAAVVDLGQTTESTATAITVPRAGAYEFWVGGWILDRLRLVVDGRTVASTIGQLNWYPQLTPLGIAHLARGVHQVELLYGSGGLRPGSRGPQYGLGPLEVGRPTSDSALLTVAPAAAASLCGHSFDWIEAVTP